MSCDTSKNTKKCIARQMEGGSQGHPGGAPRRDKRARGSAPRHPGRVHVEMRGIPEPSGFGPDLLPHALPLLQQPCLRFRSYG
jgi:hypothetical protein